MFCLVFWKNYADNELLGQVTDIQSIRTSAYNDMSYN